MTKTTQTTSPGPTPPRDYGGGDQWAPEGDDYYVPPELREFYATAEPSAVEKAGYVQGGVSVSQDIEHEVPRVVSPGRDDGDAVVTYEKRVVSTLVDLQGPSGYQQWLHIMRLQRAQQAKRHADYWKVVESHYVACQVCGDRNASVRVDRVTYAGSELIFRGCPAHLPVLAEVAQRALVTHVAEQALPDGRRVGDVATQVVAGLLDRQDGVA